MLKMPTKSDVLNQPFLDYIAQQFQLDAFGNQGIEHWLRVLTTGRQIAQRIDVNIKVIELFSLIHDSRRWNDFDDPLHGHRAAEFCETLNYRWFEADETEIRLLRTACRYHSAGNLHPNSTVQACWDANRLDSARIGVTPNQRSLGAYLEQNHDIVLTAIQRSSQSFFS